METQAHASSHSILFQPYGKLCEVEDLQTVLEAARSHGIEIQSDCGGQAICGKCLIAAHPENCLGPVSGEERSLLSPDQLARGERLACQARIRGSGVIDSLISDQIDVSFKTGISGAFPVDAAIDRLVIPGLELRANCGDLTSAASSCAHSLFGKEVSFAEVTAIAELSRAARTGGPLTLVGHRERGVTAVLSGEHQGSFGIAADLGTTTLALYLCDLQTGRVVSTAGTGNPQRLFGEDVISRIAYADNNEGGAGLLQKLVVDKINELTGPLISGAGIRREDIDEMVVVGNTTMETLFAGFHPHSLGVSPYLPPRRLPGDFRARDLGVDLNPGANIYVFPVISGFLGGDTLGAILAEQPHHKDEVLLIIDIGTNGELVLGNRKALWATSCATGPAFEGAHISRGMRAAPGAIHKVDIDPETLRPSYEVLGDNGRVQPQGICGSGIIDAVAAMRRAGLLRPNGRLVEGMPGVFADGGHIGQRFVLAPAEDSSREIAITIQDVRQVQLAKAALFAGIKILLRQAGLSRVDQVVLTGAFGARFDWGNAVSIGMFPDLGANIKVAGNAAGMGAILALLDRKRRIEAIELSEMVRCVELAEEPDFQREYILGMNFPD
ncbi:MAG: ASKHA domain-containing protein [Desulfobaccales bacterium]